MAQVRQGLYKDLKCLNVGNFGGLPHESASTWLQNFEYKTGMFNIDDPRKLLLFPLLLTERAMQWYMKLQELPNQEELTWEQLAINFREEFILGSQMDQMRKRADFHATMQSATETVDEFSFRLQKAGNELQLADNEIFQKFLTGLRPELRCSILLHNPQTMQVAKALAKTAEGLIFNPHSQAVGVNVITTTSHEQLSSKVDDLAQKVESLLVMQTKSKEAVAGNSYQENPERNGSLSRNHFERTRTYQNTRHRYRSPSPRAGYRCPSPRAREDDYMSTIQCYSCRRYGHKAFQCRERSRFTGYRNSSYSNRRQNEDF